MKFIAAGFLVVGVFLGLVAPHLWADSITGAGVQLPKFIWSKSPAASIQLNAISLLQITGAFFVALAAFCFFLLRGGIKK